ncbi:hypothetical protein AAG94_22595 [Escherichia albertii]|nr:hypothetical protein [Escherichia albertii]EFO0970593.1 hypothetical protein [Escherichia albertii]EFO4721212.1 hypothetical protein [Escherichia albertii]
MDRLTTSYFPEYEAIMKRNKRVRRFLIYATVVLKSIAHHNYFSVVANIALFFILMRFYQGLWSFDVYRRGNYQWKIFAG